MAHPGKVLLETASGSRGAKLKAAFDTFYGELRSALRATAFTIAEIHSKHVQRNDAVVSEVRQRPAVTKVFASVRNGRDSELKQLWGYAVIKAVEEDAAARLGGGDGDSVRDERAVVPTPRQAVVAPGALDPTPPPQWAGQTLTSTKHSSAALADARRLADARKARLGEPYEAAFDMLDASLLPVEPSEAPAAAGVGEPAAGGSPPAAPTPAP